MSLSRALAAVPRLRGPRVERRDVQFDRELIESLRVGGALTSAAGVAVTGDTAMRNTAVLACVLLIAESLASVPLVLYEKRPDGGRVARPDHPLYKVLHDLANPLMTAMDVRSMMLAHVLLHGNAYAEIEWNADGYPVGLWPLDPQRVGVELTADRQLLYTYFSDKFGGVMLPAWRIHHIRGLMTRGVLGMSVIRSAMNAVGLAAAAEEYGSLYFANGASPSIVLSHPAKLSPEAMKNLRASFEAQWAGLDNAHRIAVVGESVKPEAMQVPMDEAQFLETRQFQVREIARIFKVPLFLLGETQTATFASAEQEMLRFRELTLGPWAERQEKSIYRDLLTEEEQRTMFASHKLSKLQATDLKTRYETFNIGKNAGILTTNEVREMEDMNPVAGGDMLWMPVNMAPADQVAHQADSQADHQQPDHQGDQHPDSQHPDHQGDQHPDGQADQQGTSTDQQAQDTPTRGAETLADAWTADVQRRLMARIENDVRQGGGKALRNGGRVALSEWGEEQMHDWRKAGESMLAPLIVAGGAPVVDVGGWVATAYQSAVRSLIDEQ